MVQTVQASNIKELGEPVDLFGLEQNFERLDISLYCRRRVTHQNVANCFTTLAEPIRSNSTLSK